MYIIKQTENNRKRCWRRGRPLVLYFALPLGVPVNHSFCSTAFFFQPALCHLFKFNLSSSPLRKAHDCPMICFSLLAFYISQLLQLLWVSGSVQSSVQIFAEGSLEQNASGPVVYCIFIGCWYLWALLRWSSPCPVQSRMVCFIYLAFICLAKRVLLRKCLPHNLPTMPHQLKNEMKMKITMTETVSVVWGVSCSCYSYTCLSRWFTCLRLAFFALVYSTVLISLWLMGMLLSLFYFTSSVFTVWDRRNGQINPCCNMWCPWFHFNLWLAFQKFSELWY